MPNYEVPQVFPHFLGFLGNRLPDREARVEEFFLKAVAQLPHYHFILAGNGWQDKPIPDNIQYLGYLYTTDRDNVSCVQSWNQTELRSATGRVNSEGNN